MNFYAISQSASMAETSQKNVPETFPGAIKWTSSNAPTITNVLFATDFSPASEAALAYAISIVRHYRSTLHVAHVINPEIYGLMTPQIIDRMLSQLQEAAATRIDELILAEQVASVEAVIATGAVGVNIEDSLPRQHGKLAEIETQAELIAALRALATRLGVPFVINARVDVFLRSEGEPAEQFGLAVERANAYLRAGADCVYPIGWLDSATIGRLVAAIDGPLNIMGGGQGPTLPELARLDVARVSLASGVMRAALGHIRAIARELLATGGYETLTRDALTGAELGALFDE